MQHEQSPAADEWITYIDTGHDAHHCHDRQQHTCCRAPLDAPSLLMIRGKVFAPDQGSKYTSLHNPDTDSDSPELLRQSTTKEDMVTPREV